jgi:hypothetical protein
LVDLDNVLLSTGQSGVEVGRGCTRRVIRQKPPTLEIPEVLTVREVAAILKLSPESVTRRFESYPGVINLGKPETRFKRAYQVLRIPRPVLQRFLIESRV